MSYQKVLSLANKFAQDNQDDSFLQRYRAILNEMEGDYMTLRIKRLDRPILHELGKLYHNLFEIFKSTHEVKEISVALTRFVSQQTSNIHKLDATIQDFLKQNQVDFLPGPGFKQVEVHSIKKLFGLTKTIPQLIMPSPNEEYTTPTSGPIDQTRV